MELFNQTSYGVESFSLEFNTDDNTLYLKALAKTAGKLIDRVLEQKERIIFQAIVQKGCTQAQVAERLNLSQPTVSRIFKRAKGKLRYALEISSLAIKQYMEVNNGLE